MSNVTDSIRDILQSLIDVGYYDSIKKNFSNERLKELGVDISDEEKKEVARKKQDQYCIDRKRKEIELGSKTIKAIIMDEWIRNNYEI